MVILLDIFIDITDIIMVKFHFTNKKLEKLYTVGKSTKYKLEQHVIRDFIWLVGVIDAAKDIHDFWKQPALNFEKVRGYKTQYSFRITRQYRLEVDIVWENEEQTVGIVGIDEISKHYQ